MNPEAQRMAIAEACGITVEPCTCTAYPWRDAKTKEHIPDYLNDLNAIHEAEVELVGRNWGDYYRLLCAMQPAYAEERAIFSTAAQRSEALVKYLGRWKP